MSLNVYVVKKKKKNIQCLIMQFVHVIKLCNVHVATKTCVLWLSWVSQGEMHLHKRIPRHYFCLEKYLSISPSICKSQRGCRRWHKYAPRPGGRKRQECKPQYYAWGWIYKWTTCRWVRMSDWTLSRACCCSRRGCACRGKCGSTWGGGGGWRHSGADMIICSGRDCIGLGMLTQSLAHSIWITVFAALAFDRADALFHNIPTRRTGFLPWGFLGSYVFSHFGPSLLIWIEVILFRQCLGSICQGDHHLETVLDSFECLKIRGCVIT